MAILIRNTLKMLRNIYDLKLNMLTYSKYHTTRLLRCNVQEKVKKEDKPESTVDVQDVERHARLMKEWWDVDGPMKALHSYNLIRVPFIRDGLVSRYDSIRSSEPLLNKRLLDIGCGGGILAEPLAKLGAYVTGVDASEELIKCARDHADKNPNINPNFLTYIWTSIEDHAVNNKEIYDAVVASEIIEHVNNKELFVKSCIEVLKPNGKIFFTTPNRTQLANFGVIFMAENVLKVLPPGTHEYEKFIKPNELSLLLERNDCAVEVIYGIIFNPVTGRWSWSNYQMFAYGLQARKLAQPKSQKS